MVDEKFIMISMEDSKTKSIAEVLGSKTCKKILDYLAEHEEASEKDLSDALKIPMNTLEYNVKKLLESGFIQKRKNFFWSTKGKKIAMYELSNKSIVISPKKSLGSKFSALIPGLLLTLSGSFAIWVYEKIKAVPQNIPTGSETALLKSVDMATPSVANSLYGYGASDAIAQTSSFMYYPPSPAWTWFLAGGLLILFLYSIINWRKL